MNIKKYVKLRKSIKKLKNNKFTIDQNQVLNGNLKMIPEIKILYFQSKKELNIFQVTFIVWFYNDNENETMHYYSLSNFDEDYVIDAKWNIMHVYRYKALGTAADVDKKIYSFLENCLPTDIYEYGDFINILKGINGEITDYLYKTGNYKIDTENSINQFDNNSEFEALNGETVKKLIKKAHREYMDNKTTDSNHND